MITYLQKGLFLDSKDRIDCTCKVCGKPTSKLHTGFSFESWENSKQFIDRYNDNTNYWFRLFVTMSEGKSPQEFLLRYNTPYSLCSEDCLKEYIAGHETTILMSVLNDTQDVT